MLSRKTGQTGSVNILVVDVGGTRVKVLATGQSTRCEFTSGPDMTAHEMVAHVKRLTSDWRYDAVSIGYPGPVRNGQPVAEPHNLGGGWVNYDFQKAFERPVKIINDAAMQALGSYNGGRMLFLGLVTGLGSALIVDSVLVPLELAHLPYRTGRTYEDAVGLRGLQRLGKKEWRKAVQQVVELFAAALEVDDVVLGWRECEPVEDAPSSSSTRWQRCRLRWWSSALDRQPAGRRQRGNAYVALTP